MQRETVSKKRLIAVLALFAVICSLVILVGVGRNPFQSEKREQEYSITGFAFDTTYTITLYQGGSEELLQECTGRCASYEQIFSRTKKTSELYQVNQISHCYREVLETQRLNRFLRKETVSLSKKEREGLEQKIGEKAQIEKEFTIWQDGSLQIPVSESLAGLIQEGLQYGRDSDGIFDIAIEPVSSLWDFKSEKPKVPEKSQIQEALSYVDVENVTLDGSQLVFGMPGVGLDLGGIAKGYIADQLKTYLVEQGVTSGLINLGGNVLCIGEKNGSEPFSVGIQQPFADRNDTIAAIAVKDQSVVSSGIYERYFEQDGRLYHHILDPQTGYPRENDLAAVTIVSDRSVDGDGLSTTSFGLGVERGIEFINSLPGVTAVFVTKDGKMHYADGFSDLLVQ